LLALIPPLFDINIKQAIYAWKSFPFASIRGLGMKIALVA
jgi:hypothetical protein